jgi:excisionase family DNA binding protein
MSGFRRSNASREDQPSSPHREPMEEQGDPRLPLLLRPEEAAAALGVGRTTVYELMRSGALPAVHIGRAVRIPTRAVITFVDRQLAREDGTVPAPTASLSPTTARQRNQAREVHVTTAASAAG